MEKKRRRNGLSAIVRRTMAVFLCSAMVATGLPQMAAIVYADPVDTTIDFYYYVGETDDEIGLYYYGSNISSSADSTTWKVWNSDPYPYSMTETDYPGWYYVPITFSSNGASSGFQVYKQSNAGTNNCEYKSDDWVTDGSYATFTTGGESAYAVANGVIYAGDDLVNAKLRTVTLHVYDDEGVPTLWTSGMLKRVNETSATLENITGGQSYSEGTCYAMTADSEIGDNWYSLTYATPEADGTTKEVLRLKSFHAESGETPAGYTDKVTFVENSAGAGEADYRPVYQSNTYYKDGNLYNSVPADLSGLRELLRKANRKVSINQTKHYYDTTSEEWITFTGKITLTETFLEEALTEAKTSAQIEAAYTALSGAMNALVPVEIENNFLNVTRVNIDDDFITGADVSSYYALKQSGTVFKNAEGHALTDQEFFNLLADGGCNWIRIRVWNDPYNSVSEKGYGGGNNDITKAVAMGQWATAAGMRVLIDFHYSDFWADPGKQKAPKAWATMSIDDKEAAVQTFTYTSLKTLLDAGVDVGMIQVGNETNGKVCGETTWANMAKIFNAGSTAARAFAEDANYDNREILVAVHFTNPEASGRQDGYAANLASNYVDYDVFSTSYYPYWHGTINNLKTVLGGIADSYGKKVMVAETSWATTLDDGDGHENTVRVGMNDNPSEAYGFSLQGQANEIRTVVNAINDTDGGIGVFYWEPAWISPYYAYDDEGEIVESVLDANKAKWEEYGSGWASSYATEYDPTDAGVYFGGSAVDNQAWFDFTGKAIETVNTYKYIRTGAKNVAPVSVSDITENITVKANVGDEINWNTVASNYVSVNYSDENDHTTGMTAVWNEADLAAATCDASGTYTVRGQLTVAYSYTNADEQEVNESETFNIVLTLIVSSTVNELTNPGFENGLTGWSNPDSKFNTSNGDARSESGYAHFYSGEAISAWTLSQTVESLPAGTYTAGAYIQGGDAALSDVQKLNVYVYGEGEETPKQTYSAEATLAGWEVWQNPEITEIAIEDGDSIKYEIEVNSSVAEAWGTVDDCYLYGRYPVTVNNASGGTISVSNTLPVNGDMVTVTAAPSSGYVLNKIILEGERIPTSEEMAEGFMPEVAGTSVAYEVVDLGGDMIHGKATITFSSPSEAASSIKFIMDWAEVNVTAEYTYIGEYTPPTINITGITVTPTSETVEKGKTLTLTASLLPSYTNETATITWSSSNEAVATVAAGSGAASTGTTTGSGTAATGNNITVTGVEKGKAVIKASVTGKNGTFTSECTVTVTDEVIKVTGITVDPTTAKVAPGKTVSVTAALLPDTQTENPRITWTSENPEIATVAAAENGLTATITGVKEGTATITASVTTDSGPFTATTSIEVKKGAVLINDIRLSPAMLTLREGEMVSIDAQIRPEDHTEEADVVWTVGDKKVVSLKNGRVTGLKEGTTTITASVTVENGTYTATCTVTVKGHSSNLNIKVEDFDEETYKGKVTVTCPVCGMTLYSGTLIGTENPDKSYKFTFTVDNEPYSVDWYNHDHNWGAPTWTWADSTAASAKFVCAAGKESRDVKALIQVIRENSLGMRLVSAFVTGPDNLTYKDSKWFDKNGNVTTEPGIGIEGLEEAYDYSGTKITPAFIVVDYACDKVLANTTDYTIKWGKNKVVGKAAGSVTIQGKGNYVGKTVTATFDIVDRAAKANTTSMLDLKGAKFGKIGPVTYNGKEQYPDFTLTLKGDSAVTYTWNGSAYVNGDDKEIDAVVTLANNVNKGTATILIAGKDNTQAKKTFKINPVDLSKVGSDNSDNLKLVSAGEAVWAPKGAVPSYLEIVYTNADGDGLQLVQGQDYTVKYGYATKTRDAGKDAGNVTISGKGNFKSKFGTAFKFDIRKLELSEENVAVVAYAGMKAKSTKINIFDGAGKALAKKYLSVKLYEDGSYTDTDTFPSSVKFAGGTTYKVVVEPKDGDGDAYISGSASIEFVAANNLGKAKVVGLTGKGAFTVEYTGEEIRLEDLDQNPFVNGKITVIFKAGRINHTLEYGKDFEIAEYANNINKGSMSVTIRGIGENYSGTKTFKVKIVPREMKKAE